MARHCVYSRVLLMVAEGIMKTEESLSVSACLICKRDSLEPSGSTLDLGEVLTRWEKEVGVTFSSSVWQEYDSPQTRLVALYRCSNCGFSMFLPSRAGSQEFYSAISERNTYYVAEKWEFKEAFKDLKKHNVRRVLDIGCGNGYFLDLLRERCLAVECAGYEFNSQMATQARTKGHRVYDGRFPECLSPVFQDAPFDAICLFQLLEHVSDPVALIKDALRLLAPKGILIIGVPDAGGPLRHFSSALTEIPPHHVSRWYESVFRLGMTHQGFRIIRMAHEPLPFYLWSSYLPVMVGKDILPSVIGKALNRTGTTRLLINLLMASGIKVLHGVPGHTLYVVLKRA